jgi:colanic acid/amylovoran biosynthesis glycosyltransferase
MQAEAEAVRMKTASPASHAALGTKHDPTLDPIPVAALRIAYLCSKYPAVSHTFVLREVNALRELGADVCTFSIRRAASDQLLAHADRLAFESTYAIVPPRWRDLLTGHLRLIARSPRAYLSTLVLAMRMAPTGMRGRLWQLFYFVESVILWQECKRRGLRHIHVHLANVAADVALLVAHIGTALEPERPWSWSLTMHGPSEFFDVSRFRLAEKLRCAKFVICISDFARSQLMALSDPDIWDRFHVVHVGIPIAQFTREASPPVEGSSILFVGRLVAVKGQAVLLESLALLAERGLRVRTVIAGEGPMRTRLEQLVERLRLNSQVSFAGAVGQDEIHALYADASIFCLPSFAEGVPCVLMEAMAMKLPVVTTRIAGVPELVDDGRSGVLVAPGRADQLADALERLLIDPALRARMGSLAREKVVREFNADTSSEQLRRVFATYLGAA